MTFSQYSLLYRFGLPFIAQRCRCRVSSSEGRACVCFAQLPEVVRSTYGKLVDRVPVPAREEPDGDSAYNIVVVWYDKRA